MPKISRRKQSKPQHICGEDEPTNGESNNGPVGKDAVEDNNANIVVTEEEEKDETSKVDSGEENNAENSDDIIPLQLEAEDVDDYSNLKCDETDDRNTFDTDSNHSYDHGGDSEVGQSEEHNFHTPSSSDRMCDFCGAVKKSPSDLARHLLKHTGEHPFKCDLCDKAFKSKRSLQHHQHTVHGISLAVSMVAIDASITANRKRKSDESVGCHSSPESETKKIKSEVQDLYSYPSMVYCGEPQGSVYISDASCSSTGSFKISPTSTKLCSEDGNNRTCQVCGKTCSKPSDLKRHMMSHTGERPFRCNICGKAFRAKNSMFYHQKSSHGLNIELSPGLQERFMKLKKQNRLNTLMSQPNGCSISYTNEEPKDIHIHNDPQMASSLLLQKLGQKVRCANNQVLYSYDINTHEEGEVELDENTGLFKQSGSIFNKPLVSAGHIKPEPLKLTNSMVGMQIVQESHKVKRHICVKNETVLVTRLDGVDVLTAKDVSLYKCYLCGKLFDDLLKIQCHLSMHFQRDLTLYRCQLCDDTFWFKYRVINHIRKNHPKESNLALKKAEKDLRETLDDKPSVDIIEIEVTVKEENDKKKKEDTLSLMEGDEKVKVDEMETEKDSKQNEEIGKNKEPIKDPEKEKREEQQNDQMEETTSIKIEENPVDEKEGDEDVVSTSDKDITKDVPVPDLYDLSNKAMKYDPLGKLYKGIRFKKKPNGSFICLLCRKSFYKESALLQHIKIHNQQHICYCEQCGDGFMEYGKLRLHIMGDHKKNDDDDATALPSATAKNTLLSSLLSKTSQWHKPPTPSIPVPNDKIFEKAREILQKEGIQEDVTVVLPSEPDEENSTETRKANLDNILSNQESEIFVQKNSDESEIQISPKRLLMSKLLSKSKRKSSQPIKLENTDPMDCENVVVTRSDSEREIFTVKQEPVVDEKELLPPPVSIPVPISTSSFPVINSELMAAKLNNLAMLHPGIHPVVMANTLATLAAQGVPITSQGMLLASGNILSGITPGLPMVALPPQTSNGVFGTSIPQIQQPVQSNPTISVPISLTIPKQESEDAVVIKEEPKSPIENIDSNSNHSSNVSNDELSESDREKLVGCPRVQWNDPDKSEPLLEGNPSNLPLSLQQGWGLSSDGRKVTSLSRTHSRLPVVSTPVDREKICKPTVLADGRTVFRCPFCNKDFLSYSDINRHMDFHEDIRPFKCKYCEYYARTNSQLKVHMMRHQGIREFCCKLCNYKGVTQSDLNRHMKSQIHLLKAKHACPHCDEGFVTPRNLDRHLDGNCIVKMQKLETGELILK
ncbi:uncharacterized protein LOC143064014 [Mytilus galloprovincialis]|uniref:uncharacterized protein LOC143064014 n=1 Tax=Mytilus galloprovincialis TaxID=29158 RepID=UPI003F7C3326